MRGKSETKIIKKTVVIHPLMDSYVRKTWSLMVDAGYDGTYSSALNIMLLMSILEATKKDGLAQQTRDEIWKFATDQATIKRLNLEERLDNIRQLIGGRGNEASR